MITSVNGKTGKKRWYTKLLLTSEISGKQCQFFMEISQTSVPSLMCQQCLFVDISSFVFVPPSLNFIVQCLPLLTLDPVYSDHHFSARTGFEWSSCQFRLQTCGFLFWGGAKFHSFYLFASKRGHQWPPDVTVLWLLWEADWRDGVDSGLLRQCAWQGVLD